MRQHQHVSYAKYGYIFCIPFVVAFLTFMLYPLIYTTVIGFTKMSGIATPDNPPNWSLMDDLFGNFTQVIGNRSFQVAFSNTIKIWIINFIPQMLAALLFAAWFTRRRSKYRGQGFFKVLFYMPNIITAATIALMFNSIFSFPQGPINSFLVDVGLRSQPYNFLTSKTASQLIIAFIQFWMWYGYTMLILISGVLGLNPEMYDQAEIDGATGAQQFFQITLPNLRTIMLFTLVTSMVGGLNMFDIPRVFNDGMPDLGTTTTSLFIYKQAFTNPYQYNRAAAASMIMFVIIAILAAVLFYAMRDRDAEREKREIRELEKKRKEEGRVSQ